MTDRVLSEVRYERNKQDAKWGQQNHAHGTGRPDDEWVADATRKLCDSAFADGRGSWRYILNEEVAEAYAETSLDGLRTELVQVAAVAVAWIEAIDRELEAGQ